MPHHTKHRLYSTVMAAMWLWPNMSANQAALFAVSTAYFYLGSIPEEQKLVEEFGEAYQRYRDAVPRLIPRPWRVYRSE